MQMLLEVMLWIKQDLLKVMMFSVSPRVLDEYANSVTAFVFKT
jgi:hypothetical protein